MMTRKNNLVTDNPTPTETGDVLDGKTKNKVIEKNLAQKKVDKATGQIQYY